MDVHLEVIDDALAIQEIVDYGEEVPAQCFAPRIFALILDGFRIHERK